MYTHNLQSEFSFSMHGDKVTINKQRSDLDMQELLDVITALVLASGWSERTWHDAILDFAANIEDDRRHNLPESKVDDWPDFAGEEGGIL